MKSVPQIAMCCALLLFLVSGTAQAASCVLPSLNGSARCGGILELAPGQRIRIHLSKSKGNFKIKVTVKILLDKSKPPTSDDADHWTKIFDPGDEIFSEINDLKHPISVYIEFEAEKFINEIMGGTIIYEVSTE